MTKRTTLVTIGILSILTASWPIYGWSLNIKEMSLLASKQDHTSFKKKQTGNKTNIIESSSSSYTVQYGAHFDIGKSNIQSIIGSGFRGIGADRELLFWGGVLYKRKIGVIAQSGESGLDIHIQYTLEKQISKRLSIGAVINAFSIQGESTKTPFLTNTSFKVSQQFGTIKKKSKKKTSQKKQKYPSLSDYEYKDMKNTPYHMSSAKLRYLGLLSNNERFNPTNTINRAEFSTFLANIFQLEELQPTANIDDISSEDEFFKEVNSVVRKGILTLFGSELKTKDTVTHAMAITALVRAFNYNPKNYERRLLFEDMPSDYWATPYANVAVEEHIIPIKPLLFRPKEPITKKTLLKWILNYPPVKKKLKPVIFEEEML